jgi:hypothetical protein
MTKAEVEVGMERPGGATGKPNGAAITSKSKSTSTNASTQRHR